MSVALAGASVLVTGASSGIGAALAVTLAERGARVGIVGRRADRLEAVAARCRDLGAECTTWVQDLGDLEAAQALALEAWDRFGHLDVLVDNAAIPKRRPIQRLTADELAETMRVDFESPARMTMTLLPRLLARVAGPSDDVAGRGGPPGDP